MKPEISFEIIKRYGVFADTSNPDWKWELNVVSWNKGIPKFDCRRWTRDHSRMTRGITFREDELKGLYKILNEYNFDNFENDCDTKPETLTARNGSECTIYKKIGVLAITPLGWNKELNIISWNGEKGPVKFDIRDFEPNTVRGTFKASIGVRMDKTVLMGLRDLLTRTFPTEEDIKIPEKEI